MGRGLLLGLLFLAALALPQEASAAVPLAPCKPNGVLCATVDVPLDRSGRVPGSISLHVEELPAVGQARGVMLLVAGGPGQGSAGSFDLGDAGLVAFMRALMPGYTLVAFDNRGTGKSGLIDCPALQRTFPTSAEQGAALARDCAAIIGPRRQFYATRDHAEDIDAVRTALGFAKIGLYGVSYGTKLSLAYALAHPTAVDRLLLDSVVQPSFPDPFYRNVMRELPGALRSFCAGGICRGATRDFSAEFVALANRLEARPIRGKVVIPNGKLKTIRMNGEDLLTLMIDADLNPGLAAEMPAAVHAARSGYFRPLLRLYDLDMRTSMLSTEDLSFGLNAATNCADGRFPWAPNTPPSQRRAAIDAALAGLLPGSLGPFGSWAARLGTAYFCEQWPEPVGNTPLGAGPLPNVPVLAVNGGFDLRTPVANAIAVVNQFPQGRLLVVPGVGHSVLTADLSGCSFSYVRAWMQGPVDAPTRAVCRRRVPPLVRVMGTFPRRAARPSASATLSLAAKALREAQATYVQVALAPSPFVARGIYGGRLAVASNGNRFTLKRYSIAPGVYISGTVTRVAWGPPSTYRGSIRVTGRAVAAGTLRFTARNALSGTLGGTRVRGRY